MPNRSASSRQRKGPSEPTDGPRAHLDQPERFPTIGTADEFRQAAIEIFGLYGWVRETSKCLGVNESTIWRWANEQTPIKGPGLAAMSAWIHIFRMTGERPPELSSEE